MTQNSQYTLLLDTDSISAHLYFILKNTAIIQESWFPAVT